MLFRYITPIVQSASSLKLPILGAMPAVSSSIFRYVQLISGAKVEANFYLIDAHMMHGRKLYISDAVFETRHASSKHSVMAFIFYRSINATVTYTCIQRIHVLRPGEQARFRFNQIYKILCGDHTGLVIDPPIHRTFLCSAASNSHDLYLHRYPPRDRRCTGFPYPDLKAKHHRADDLSD